jgi:N-acetylmuramoyl-L-alanine amidase
MEVVEAALTPNKWSRPQIAIKPVRGIVMHYVENPGTSAMFNRNFFEGLRKQKEGQTKKPIYASAHFIVDLSGEVVLCIPPNEVAYHCGEDKGRGYIYKAEALEKFGVWPNACTLGIELCHLDREGRFTEDTLASAVQLVACLCERHDLNPYYDVVRHYDVTHKPCPLWWVKHGEEFTMFCQEAKRRLLATECGAENGG